MGLRSEVGGLVAAFASFAMLASGCGGQGDDDSGAPAPSMEPGAGSSAPSMTASGAGGSDAPASSNSSNPRGGSGGLGISGGPSSSANGNTADDIMPDDVTPPPMEVLEMLDPKVDWDGLTIIFPTAYSAYDGVHNFQVPAHVDGATVELSGWQAIPSDAVTFDPDPDVDGGVLITVNKAVAQITIAASAGPIGGTSALFITEGTPEQWEAGSKRYANGVELNIPDTVDLEQFQMMLLDPNWSPPAPPPNLACNNCHSTGAKYFEVQHTPTQAARFSDDDLKSILTTGKKPEGVGFRVLPDMIFGMTAEEMYAQFHKWEASDDEIKGLIIYLRSLTPTGQGDIRLPDGTYVAPGEPPPNLPMP